MNRQPDDSSKPDEAMPEGVYDLRPYMRNQSALTQEALDRWFGFAAVTDFNDES